jgi:hypothetical protein
MIDKRHQARGGMSVAMIFTGRTVLSAVYLDGSDL